MRILERSGSPIKTGVVGWSLRRICIQTAQGSADAEKRLSSGERGIPYSY